MDNMQRIQSQAYVDKYGKEAPQCDPKDTRTFIAGVSAIKTDLLPPSFNSARR